MKFIRFRHEGKERTGYLKRGQVVDLAASLHLAAPVEQLVLDSDLMIQVRAAFERTEVPGQAVLPAEEVVFLPPVAHPGKVICAGLNYPPPTDDYQFELPEYPVLFHKTVSALTGHLQPIILPKISREVEYEGELAIVIGRRGKQIDRAEAQDYIAGYTIANDIGARDIQSRASQWTSGKMFDTFCPLGPGLVTTDEVPDPANLQIVTRLNDEIVQDDTTARMIFDAWTLVSYISELTTLLPGDVILTGSPRRVGDLPDPRMLLQEGDVISVSIEGLGVLTNRAEKEA